MQSLQNNDDDLAEIQAAYGASCTKYEVLTEAWNRKGDTVIISGHGCALKVKNDALVIFPGRTHKDQRQENTVLYRGVHNVKQIILLSDKGLITLDAVRWAIEQNIPVIMVDGHGNLMQSLAPDNESNAALRRLQYHAADSGLDIAIAREIIYRKTLSQIEMLKVSSEHKHKYIYKKRYRANKVWDKSACDLLESGLGELSQAKELRFILMLEARLALIYWDTFIGMPIRWDENDREKVPPHWRSCIERISSLSSNRTARHANNPYHAVTNYAYAILQGQCKQALVSQGFDTACGFLHTDQPHRDSLVFDLMECHRAAVDLLVLRLFATITLSKGDFMSTTDGSVKFNPQFSRYIAATCRLAQDDIDTSALWLKSLLLSS